VQVVILDEADALLTKRSTNGTPNEKNHNSVITQFLACMDGAAQRQSEQTVSGGGGAHSRRLLLLALTNHREALDPALLRPGRFEVQIALPPPGDAGRRAILELHTAKLRERHALEPAALHDFGLLSRASVGFSGADLAGVVRAAKAAALRRVVEAAAVEQPHAHVHGGEDGGTSSTSVAARARDEAKHARAAGRLAEAVVLKEELRTAMRMELRRREQWGEPGAPVSVFDADADAVDRGEKVFGGDLPCLDGSSP
jgi:vesicle-fusing ATPase